MKGFKDYELDKKELIPFKAMHEELKLQKSMYNALDSEGLLTIYVCSNNDFYFCPHQIKAIKKCDSGSLLCLKGFNAFEKEAYKYERIFNESKNK